MASRENLARALATVAELVPDAEEDDDAAWRAELVKRYQTVRGFLDALARVIPWGCVEAGAPVLAALRVLPGVLVRRPPGKEHVTEDLVSGSWRRLVFENPDLPPPRIDRAAYTFCVLEALRRRDVFAHGADKWGDPRTRLLDDTAWGIARPRVLTALGLPADPDEKLDELASRAGPGVPAGCRRAGREHGGAHRRRPHRAGAAGSGARTARHADRTGRGRGNAAAH